MGFFASIIASLQPGQEGFLRQGKEGEECRLRSTCSFLFEQPKSGGSGAAKGHSGQCCGLDQGATLSRGVCQRPSWPGGAEGGAKTSGNESFLPSSIVCELFTAEFFHPYVWREPSSWKDDEVQPMGFRVQAKDHRSCLLGPGWEAVLTAASCLAFDDMVGSRRLLGDRPLAHVWPWAHDPHLRAVLRVGHLSYVATRSISAWGSWPKASRPPRDGSTPANSWKLINFYLNRAPRGVIFFV